MAVHSSKLPFAAEADKEGHLLREERLSFRGIGIGLAGWMRFRTKEYMAAKARVGKVAGTEIQPLKPRAFKSSRGVRHRMHEAAGEQARGGSEINF